MSSIRAKRPRRLGSPIECRRFVGLDAESEATEHLATQRKNRRASREYSQVLWISSAGLDTLALAAPTAFVRLARGLGLRQANRAAALSASIAPTVSGLQQSHKASNTPKMISVIPVTEGAAVHLDDFCYSLTMALRKICRVHTVDSACRLAELGQAGGRSARAGGYDELAVEPRVGVRSRHLKG